MMTRWRRTLETPGAAAIAGLVFIVSVLLLPNERGRMSLVGAAIHEAIGNRRTNCWFPYYGRLYTVEGDVITQAEGPGAGPADDSTVVWGAICVMSRARAVWAPTLKHTHIGVEVSHQALTDAQVAAVRARVLRDAAAEGATIPTRFPQLLTADVRTTEVLWSGYAHNLVTTASLVVWVMGVRSLVVAARRERARRRDTCAGCGYDLSGLAADARCPECGELPVATDSGGT